MIWRYRLLRVAVYFSSLVLLVLYGRFFHPFVTLQMCLADPEKYDGVTIHVGNEAVIVEVLPDGFSLEQLGRRVRVLGPRDVRVGEFIILNAVFHKEGWLEVKRMRIAEKRRAKIWLSVFPAVFICIYFVARFRFDFRTLYFEER
ncbi:hypothetical protein JW998_03410 [candidate division KSB1 bacterium]|nr:hypothetical protein [candidate division KSB1 bacterium]